MLFTYDELIHFLLHARHRTYASERDQVSVAPLLAGSKQLEYREAPFFYREIYFGVNGFVGQELVCFRERPVWSMCYSGRISPEITNRDEIKQIYDFLCETLRKVSYERPFRGPQMNHAGLLRYLDATHGDIASFHGEEMILRGGKQAYQLHYAGGILQ